MQGNCTTPKSVDPNVNLIPLGTSDYADSQANCLIEVLEDFLEAPIGTPQLWLDNLWVVVREGSPLNSSTVLLHADGEVWWTRSVLQGRRAFSRGIDVSTQDGGKPRMYLGGG